MDEFLRIGGIVICAILMAVPMAAGVLLFMLGPAAKLGDRIAARAAEDRELDRMTMTAIRGGNQ